MAVTVEELILEYDSNFEKFNRNLDAAVRKATTDAQRLGRAFAKSLDLTVTVDDRQVTALNKHLDQKEAHVDRLQSKWNRNPLTVKVNDTEIDRSVKKLETLQKTAAATVRSVQSIGSATATVQTHVTHQIESSRFISNFEKAGDRVAENFQSKLARERVAGVQQTGIFSRNLERILKDANKQSLLDRVGSVITAPFRAITASVGQVFKGAAFSVGEAAIKPIEAKLAAQLAPITQFVGQRVGNVFDNTSKFVQAKSGITPEQALGALDKVGQKIDHIFDARNIYNALKTGVGYVGAVEYQTRGNRGEIPNIVGRNFGEAVTTNPFIKNVILERDLSKTAQYIGSIDKDFVSLNRVMLSTVGIIPDLIREFTLFGAIQRTQQRKSQLNYQLDPHRPSVVFSGGFGDFGKHGDYHASTYRAGTMGSNVVGVRNLVTDGPGDQGILYTTLNSILTRLNVQEKGILGMVSVLEHLAKTSLTGVTEDEINLAANALYAEELSTKSDIVAYCGGNLVAKGAAEIIEKGFPQSSVTAKGFAFGTPDIVRPSSPRFSSAISTADPVHAFGTLFGARFQSINQDAEVGQAYHGIVNYLTQPNAAQFLGVNPTLTPKEMLRGTFAKKDNSPTQQIAQFQREIAEGQNVIESATKLLKNLATTYQSIDKDLMGSKPVNDLNVVIHEIYKNIQLGLDKLQEGLISTESATEIFRANAFIIHSDLGTKKQTFVKSKAPQLTTVSLAKPIEEYTNAQLKEIQNRLTQKLQAATQAELEGGAVLGGAESVKADLDALNRYIAALGTTAATVTPKLAAIESQLELSLDIANQSPTAQSVDLPNPPKFDLSKILSISVLKDIIVAGNIVTRGSTTKFDRQLELNLPKQGIPVVVPPKTEPQASVVQRVADAVKDLAKERIAEKVGTSAVATDYIATAAKDVAAIAQGAKDVVIYARTQREANTRKSALGYLQKQGVDEASARALSLVFSAGELKNLSKNYGTLKKNYSDTELQNLLNETLILPEEIKSVLLKTLGALNKGVKSVQRPDVPTVSGQGDQKYNQEVGKAFNGIIQALKAQEKRIIAQQTADPLSRATATAQSVASKALVAVVNNPVGKAVVSAGQTAQRTEDALFARDPTRITTALKFILSNFVVPQAALKAGAAFLPGPAGAVAGGADVVLSQLNRVVDSLTEVVVAGGIDDAAARMIIQAAESGAAPEAGILQHLEHMAAGAIQNLEHTATQALSTFAADTAEMTAKAGTRAVADNAAIDIAIAGGKQVIERGVKDMVEVINTSLTPETAAVQKTVGAVEKVFTKPDPVQNYGLAEFRAETRQLRRDINLSTRTESAQLLRQNPRLSTENPLSLLSSKERISSVASILDADRKRITEQLIKKNPQTDSTIDLSKRINEKLYGIDRIQRLLVAANTEVKGDFGKPGVDLTQYNRAASQLGKASQGLRRSLVVDVEQIKKLAEAGDESARGLLLSLEASIKPLQATANALGKSFILEFKRVLGIASPSKVMIWMGQQVAAGFEVGLEELPDLEDTLKRLLGNLGTPELANVDQYVAQIRTLVESGVANIEVNLPDIQVNQRAGFNAGRIIADAAQTSKQAIDHAAPQVQPVFEGIGYEVGAGVAEIANVAAEGAKGAWENLAALLNTVSPGLGGFVEGFGERLDALGAKSPTLGRITNNFKEIAVAVVGAGAALLFVLAPLNQFYASSIQAANEYRNLTYLIQGTGQTTRSLSDLEHYADRIGTNFKEAAGSYADFAGSLMGTPLAEDALELEQKILGITKALNLSQERSNQFAIAVQQMGAKGVVSMEELRGQASEAVPQSTVAAAAALNTEVSQLTNIIGQGTTSSYEFLPKFLDSLSQMTSATLESTSQNLDAQMARIANAFDRLQRSAGATPLDVVTAAAAVAARALGFLADNAELVNLALTVGMIAATSHIATTVIKVLKLAQAWEALSALGVRGIFAKGVAGVTQGIKALLATLNPVTVAVIGLTAAWAIFDALSSRGTSSVIALTDQLTKSLQDNERALKGRNTQASTLPTPKPQATSTGGQLLDTLGAPLGYLAERSPFTNLYAKLFQGKDKFEFVTHGMMDAQKAAQQTEQALAEVDKRIAKVNQTGLNSDSLQDYATKAKDLQGQIEAIGAKLNLSGAGINPLSSADKSKLLAERKALQTQLDTLNAETMAGFGSLSGIQSAIDKWKQARAEMEATNVSSQHPELLNSIDKRITSLQKLYDNFSNVMALNKPLFDLAAAQGRLDQGNINAAINEATQRGALARLQSQFAIPPGEASIREAQIERNALRQRLGELERFVEARNRLLSELPPGIKTGLEGLLGGPIASATQEQIVKAQQQVETDPNRFSALKPYVDKLGDLNQAKQDMASLNQSIEESNNRISQSTKEFADQYNDLVYQIEQQTRQMGRTVEDARNQAKDAITESQLEIKRLLLQIKSTRSTNAIRSTVKGFANDTSTQVVESISSYLESVFDTLSSELDQLGNNQKLTQAIRDITLGKTDLFHNLTDQQRQMALQMAQFQGIPGASAYTPIPGARVNVGSWTDASGEPGSDFTIHNKKDQVLGVPVGFPVESRVLKKFNDGSGYGNAVELRFKYLGKEIDVLLGHFQKINAAIVPGQTLPAGTVIGEQGRSGHTSAGVNGARNPGGDLGTHVSADFYQPGSNVGIPDSLRIKFLKEVWFPFIEKGFTPANFAANNIKPFSMPASSLGAIDTFIKKYAPKSVLTGTDFAAASQQSGVSIDALVTQALIESHFGTTGRAAYTKNPLNYGNDDAGNDKYFKSFREGLIHAAKALKEDFYVTTPESFMERGFKGRYGIYATDPQYMQKYQGALTKVRGAIGSTTATGQGLPMPAVPNATGQLSTIPYAQQVGGLQQQYALTNQLSQVQQATKKIQTEQQFRNIIHQLNDIQKQNRYNLEDLGNRVTGVFDSYAPETTVNSILSSVVQTEQSRVGEIRQFTDDIASLQRNVDTYRALIESLTQQLTVVPEANRPQIKATIKELSETLTSDQAKLEQYKRALGDIKEAGGLTATILNRKLREALDATTQEQRQFRRELISLSRMDGPLTPLINDLENVSRQFEDARLKTTDYLKQLNAELKSAASKANTARQQGNLPQANALDAYAKGISIQIGLLTQQSDINLSSEAEKQLVNKIQTEFNLDKIFEKISYTRQVQSSYYEALAQGEKNPVTAGRYQYQARKIQIDQQFDEQMRDLDKRISDYQKDVQTIAKENLISPNQVESIARLTDVIGVSADELKQLFDLAKNAKVDPEVLEQFNTMATSLGLGSGDQDFIKGLADTSDLSGAQIEQIGQLAQNLGLSADEAERLRETLIKTREISLANLANETNYLQQQIESGLNNAFGDLFMSIGDVILGTKDAMTTLQEFGAKTLQMLAQIFADIAAKQLAAMASKFIASIFSGLPGLSGGGPVMNYAAGGPIKNYASGGPIDDFDAWALGKSIDIAMKREGVGAVPIVANTREYVLNEHDTKLWRWMGRKGITSDLRRAKAHNYSNGGTPGSDPGLMVLNSNPSSRTAPPRTIVIHQNTTINTPDANSFRATKAQVDRERAAAARRAAQRLGKD